MDTLTYHVPEALESLVRPGQLVTLPFRSQEVFGIIFDIKKDRDNQAGAIKDMSTIVHPTPLIGTAQLAILAATAAWYGMSRASTVNLFLPPLQKRKLKQLTLTEIAQKKLNTSDVHSTYHSYSSIAQRLEIITQNIFGATLILLPEIHGVDELYALLPNDIQKNTAVWHSQLSEKDQFSAWTEIRNGQKNIILGTRGAVFLPFLHLDTIIIDEEHAENHKHWDQTPRYHDMDIVKLLAAHYGTKIHLMSFSQSFGAYFSVHKGLIESEAATLSKPQTEAILVDMKDERRGKNYGMLSVATEELLFADSTCDLFFYINRRGTATAIGCHDCGYLARCVTCLLPLVYHEEDRVLRCHYCKTSSPMMLACPKCRSTVVKLIGGGTALVEKEVRRIIGGKDGRDIMVIDSDHPFEKRVSEKPRIVIGTQQAFQSVRWEKTGGIVCVDMDRELSLPEYTATEQVYHTLAEIRYRANSDARFLIQTFHPEHMVYRGLREPDRLYRTELQGRKSLGYPPYTYLVRYFFGDADQAYAAREAERVGRQLNLALTTNGISGTITGPIMMQPRYFRKKFWYTILVKLPVDSWQKNLITLNAVVPEGWRIDPNPISILSP